MLLEFDRDHTARKSAIGAWVTVILACADSYYAAVR